MYDFKSRNKSFSQQLETEGDNYSFRQHCDQQMELKSGIPASYTPLNVRESFN